MSGQEAGAPSSGGSTSGGGSTVKYVPYYRPVTGPDGQTCVELAWRPEGTPASDQAPDMIPLGGPTLGTEDNSNLYTTYPPCPTQPGVEVKDTPESFAARYWELVPLPRPQPYVAPGWAITGKLAYMETRGDVARTYTNANTPFGTLEIVATGKYYVDWGDGETTGPHAREGRPWPEGEITHDYVWARTYNIVVTERWTATWQLGGHSGVLRELRTTGRIDNFPAREIQAVIRS